MASKRKKAKKWKERHLTRKKSNEKGNGYLRKPNGKRRRRRRKRRSNGKTFGKRKELDEVEEITRRKVSGALDCSKE